MKNLTILFAFSLLACQACNKCDDDNQPSSCSLEPVAGPCEALIYKYYYDADANKCKEFLWGGCGGTVPFETMEECEVCLCKNRR